MFLLHYLLFLLTPVTPLEGYGRAACALAQQSVCQLMRPFLREPAERIFLPHKLNLSDLH